MDEYEVKTTSVYNADLWKIYLYRINYREDIPDADKFYRRVTKSVEKLSYLAGTSPNKFCYVGKRKYYIYTVERGKYSILYTLNRRQRICQVWHIFSNKMDFC